MRYALEVNGALYKSAKALQLFDEGAIISTQVVSEICSVLQKKKGATVVQCKKVVSDLQQSFQIQTITLETLHLALHIRQAYQYSQYDAQIIAAALQAGLR